MEGREYRYWLASVEALGSAAARPLLAFYGDAKTIYKEKRLPLSDALQRAIDESRKNLSDLARELEGLEKQGIQWCCPEDENYPKRLLTIPDPPLGLFFKGSLPPEDRPTVGIVGARRCSHYGRGMAERFGGELARDGVPVISGMALGIDGYAQSAALAAGGNSFAVLGCGIDVVYPPSNRKLYGDLCERGGVISELRPGTAPLPYHFPLRNRIISGLSDALLVIEAREKSGSLITVDQALEQGKDVLALPGRLDDELSRGCNNLIRQGAGILTAVADVYEVLGIESPAAIDGAKEAPEKKLTAEQRKLLKLLSMTPKHVEELAEESGKSFGELSLLLLELEEKGLIRAVSGGQYVRR